jgi:hypothetical protein
MVFGLDGKWLEDGNYEWREVPDFDETDSPLYWSQEEKFPHPCPICGRPHSQREPGDA